MNSYNWHSTPNLECAALFRIEHLSHAWRRFRSVVLRPKKTFSTGVPSEMGGHLRIPHRVTQTFPRP